MVEDDLEEALAAYQRRRGGDPNLSAAIQNVLRDFLGESGYHVTPPTRALRLPPAEPGRGFTDVSVNHDRYLAEAVLERKTGRPR